MPDWEGLVPDWEGPGADLEGLAVAADGFSMPLVNGVSEKEEGTNDFSRLKWTTLSVPPHPLLAVFYTTLLK